MILNVSAYIRPVQLPPSNLGNFDYYNVTVSGWGKISDSQYIVLLLYCLVLKTALINKTVADDKKQVAISIFNGHFE